MKTLVIYYSYEGNSALAAEEIKKAAGADLLELKTEDDTRRTGLAKYFWGGKQVVTHQSPKLKPYTVNPGDYELIIIGGPVWAGSPAPALQSFLGETKITGKRIALFVTHAGGKGKALDKLKALLPGNTIAGEIDLVNPGKQERAAVSKQIGDWVKAIQA
ncbi:flavodoxin [Treponema primitia ZAS-2]|uniref:Flavodoxin n=1 Tax=Treponema primitia (strain ATCC BAA-887 / DSM 12427 / ZAS-2) TaxID=545694 RepID=F5YJG1_TREPZ|nr:flavodoxin [Treponema primitia]AEF83542.1 flavodoxin [Treponema primitia ZAS-2]